MPTWVPTCYEDCCAKFDPEKPRSVLGPSTLGSGDEGEALSTKVLADEAPLSDKSKHDAVEQDCGDSQELFVSLSISNPTSSNSSSPPCSNSGGSDGKKSPERSPSKRFLICESEKTQQNISPEPPASVGLVGGETLRQVTSVAEDIPVRRGFFNFDYKRTTPNVSQAVLKPSSSPQSVVKRTSLWRSYTHDHVSQRKSQDDFEPLRRAQSFGVQKSRSFGVQKRILDIADFHLSPALCKALDVDEPYFTSAHKHLSQASQVSKVSKASIGEMPRKLTQVEIDRGVCIDCRYEWYCVSKRAKSSCNLTDEVFHHRSEEIVQFSSGSDSLESPRLFSRRTPRTTPRASSREGSPLGSPRVSARQLVRRTSSRYESKKGQDIASETARSRTPPNQEAISRWGVLVAKTMHCRALDLGNVADRMTDHAGQQSRKRARGVMFASVRQGAKEVMEVAMRIARSAARTADRFDREWDRSDLLVALFSKNYIDVLALLANTVRKICSVQAALVDVKAPVRIFGDLHGQFRDLLLLFFAFGSPVDDDAPDFIFNGDFVDRGEHSLEVLGLLMALKVLLPEKVWLVRGNHEDRGMNQKYGFYAECASRLGNEFGVKVFDLFQKVFNQLPLGALIEERILVVHGGIGDGAWTIPDLRKIKRPLTEEKLFAPGNQWISNILWSDPIEDDECREGGQTFGVHDSPRGARGVQFGWDITKTFCARNGLSLIVRSHQSKQGSLGFDIMHENHLVRVFSARNYEGHGNDGAVLLIEHCGLSEAPTVLKVRPQVILAIRNSTGSECAIPTSKED